MSEENDTVGPAGNNEVDVASDAGGPPAIIDDADPLEEPEVGDGDITPESHDPLDGGSVVDAASPSPSDPPPPVPLDVAVLSDLNGSYGSTTYRPEVHAAVQALVDDPPALVLLTGDLVAGQKAGLDYAAMWAGFHDAVTIPLTEAGIPVAVTPGNHDASSYAAYATEREHFAAEWAEHRPALNFVDDSHYPFRYAFTAGTTLFVALDDTRVGALDNAQEEWLDDVLDHPAETKIVFGHIPLYPFAQGRETEIIGDADLEALLIAHDVTLFVSGHHHAYFPGRRGNLRLVSMACLGDGPRVLLGTTGASPRSLVRFRIDAGELELDAYTGVTFHDVVNRESLPPFVGSGASRVERDDL
ncbi:MAG: metallophosphoesterase family protein [Myxococcota bacterium]